MTQPLNYISEVFIRFSMHVRSSTQRNTLIQHQKVHLEGVMNAAMWKIICLQILFPCTSEI